MQTVSGYRISHSNIWYYAVTPMVQICRVLVPLLIRRYVFITKLSTCAKAEITACKSSFDQVAASSDHDHVLDRWDNRTDVLQSPWI